MVKIKPFQESMFSQKSNCIATKNRVNVCIYFTQTGLWVRIIHLKKNVAIIWRPLCPLNLQSILLSKHLCDLLINSFINWLSDPLVKISLRGRHAQTIKMVLPVIKQNILKFFQKFKILKGIKIAQLVQKLLRFCWMGIFCLLVELYLEGSASAACAAGLFFLSF